MVIVDSYIAGVIMCAITMACWGSFANMQKLADKASKEWKFQLYYWDYVIGVLLLALLLAFTMGSVGEEGRPFLADLSQADSANLTRAVIGGIIFNLANLLLIIAIDIAGMSVAFPIGIGLALVIGVIDNYRTSPDEYNTFMLFSGVAGVALAIVFNALAYRRLMTGQKTATVGVVIAVLCGITMGFFYGWVVRSMATDFAQPEAGKLTPYTALVFFSIGVVLSNFVFNTVAMRWTVSGEKVSPLDYFTKGTPWLHVIGIIAGVIWSIGMSFSIIAGDAVGYAISYGLGQGATMVAAFWGVFIWREFRGAPKGTSALIAMMFASYICGLALIVIGNKAG